MKNLIYLIIIPLLMAGMGCSDDERDNVLQGTKWKLEGFATTGSPNLRIAEPSNYDKCYVLNFKTDEILEGQTSTNQITGKYNIDIKYNKLLIHDISGTEINELYDGNEYIEALLKIESYSITESGLELYYNEKLDYLLYKLIQ